MQIVPFVKFHGAGNDFIMIDDRDGYWVRHINEAWIAKVCHRRFGVGADGMILLEKGYGGADFYMRYFNADGRISTFCGNGGRCVVAFAMGLQVHEGTCRFMGADGWHEGEVLKNGLVRISMTDVEEVKHLDGHTATLYTGSPHYVKVVDQLEALDVFKEGRAIRNSPSFEQEGINVNFVELIKDGELSIRTYERGVEDETYACGTGVVAAAIAGAFLKNGDTNAWLVHAKGGDLTVDFQRIGPQEFRKVNLTGPAEAVFSGELPL
jgi:diaminopimelate epimerase